MKKQELVHLHSLLAEVAAYCGRDGVDLALAPYHDLETGPMAIGRAKSDHERAVFALSRAVSGSLGERSDEDVTARVESAAHD
jgi:hypothetical protein